MANDKNFKVKNGLDVGGTISSTDLTLLGGSDNLEFTEASGDWSILNKQQNNGLVIYDGNSGVQINYSGIAVQSWSVTDGTDLLSGSFKIGGATLVDASRNITATTLTTTGNITASGKVDASNFVVDTATDRFRFGPDNYDNTLAGPMIRPDDNVNPPDGDTLFMVRSGGGSPRFFTQHNGIIGSSNAEFYLNTASDMSGGNRVWHTGDFNSTDVSNWDTAYGWGNHATAGYVLAATLDNYLPLTGGTLTGTLNGTAADFSGNVDANEFRINGTTVIDSSGNLTNIANIEATGATLTGNLALTTDVNPTITIKNTDTTIIADQVIGTIEFRGADDSGNVLAGQIQQVASGEWGTANYGSDMIFSVKQGGTGGAFAEKLRLDYDGVGVSGDLAVSGTITATGYNDTNWNTAYGWGDHAGIYVPLAGGTLTGTITQSYDEVIWSHSEGINRPVSKKLYSEVNVGTTGTAYTDVYGEADLTGITDHATFTYNDAWAALEAVGARLPTLAELEDGVGKGSGQSYDSEYLWTCTPAGPHHVWVCYGDYQTYGLKKIVDITDAAEVYRTRGFFDVDRNTRQVNYNSSGALAFGDSQKATFGASDNLEIYSDGTNGFIKELGTGSLAIQATDLYLQTADNELYLYGNADGAVSLYHNGEQKFITSSSGVDVTGTITATGYNDTNWNTAYGWGDHAGTYLPLVGGTLSGSLTLEKTGTATVASQAYASQPLYFQASGWDTNNSIARTLSWSIKNEATASIYPDFDLSFSEGTGTIFKLHGRGTSGHVDPKAGTFYGNLHVEAGTGTNAGNGSLDVAGSITATGYNDTNWNTAYTYSQVGHLPLAGGTLTGGLGIETDLNPTITIKNTDTSIIADQVITTLEFRGADDSGNVLAGQIQQVASGDWGSADYGSDMIFSVKQGGTGGAFAEKLRLEYDGVGVSGDLAVSGTITATGYNDTNWNTAYGWGNHASAGYLSTTNYASTLNSVYAKVTRGVVTGVNKDTYVTAFTVNGDALASAIRVSFAGTGASLVVNCVADILVNHSQDILISTQQGFYTKLSIKVTSNQNEDFAVEVKHNGGVNTMSLNVEVFPLNNETIDFVSSHSYTGTIKEHFAEYGMTYSATGGGLGSITTDGIIAAAGGGSTNWNTAYNYSQVGHLPLAGGTLTGGLSGTTASFSSTLSSGAITSTVINTADATLLTLHHDTGADLAQQKSFIDFSFEDDNTNETPQVRIGAEVGQNADANTQEKEGSGAFVVYTNNADTIAGDAGASLAERFRVDYVGDTSIKTGRLIMGDTPVIDTNRNLTNIGTIFSGAITATGIDVTGAISADGLDIAANGDDNAVIVVTDTIADNSLTGLFIDHNASGSDVLTADRPHIALQIDMDSSATGGDTLNEHRLYGLHANIRATGDSDLIYGSFITAEAQQSEGQVTGLYGAYNTAIVDQDGGHLSNAHATYSYMSLTASGGTMSNAYASYNKVLVGATHDINTNKVSSVYGEVEFDPNATTQTSINSAFCFEAQFDNDTSSNVSINNGYLFYGNYTGTLPTNAFGVYIADIVDNYFAGLVRSLSGFQIGSTTFIDSNRNLTNIGTISSGSIDVTGIVTADGLTVDAAQKLIYNADDAQADSRKYQLRNDDSAYGDFGIKASASNSTEPTKNRLNINKDGDISFYDDAGTTAKFFWDASAESLGIGSNTNSNYALSISENNPTIQLRSAISTGSNTILFSDVDNNFMGNIKYDHNDNSLRFATNGIAIDDVVINSSGRVGIGTTNPPGKLTVSNNEAEGIEFFPANITGGNTTQHYDRTGLAYLINNVIASEHRFNIGATRAVTIDTNGNINLTTDVNPTITIKNTDTTIIADQVIGTIEFRGADDSGNVLAGQIQQVASGSWGTGNYGSDMIFSVKQGGTGGAFAEKLRLEYDGVGVSGDLVATGNITAFSDKRLKEDLQPIENAVGKVQLLNGVTYTRNDLEDNDLRHAGLIAQDIEQVLPEAVSETKDGVKVVNYNATIALLVEAIKDQQIQINELQAQVRGMQDG